MAAEADMCHMQKSHATNVIVVPHLDQLNVRTITQRSVMTATVVAVIGVLPQMVVWILGKLDKDHAILSVLLNAQVVALLPTIATMKIVNQLLAILGLTSSSLASIHASQKGKSHVCLRNTAMSKVVRL